MQLFANADSNVLGLIQHIDELKNVSSDLAFVVSDTNNATDRIDAIGKLNEIIKKIEPTIRVTLDEIQFFQKYCITIYNVLLSKRNELLNTIDKRRNTEVQMNTSAEMYDEENLITRFVISMENEEEPHSVFAVKMEQVREIKDYSVLSIITQFESEETLLDDIKSITDALCHLLYNDFFELNNKISKIKDACNDTEFIHQLCEDSTDGKSIIVEIQREIAFYDFITHRYTNQVMKLFQIYQELLHNYVIYDKAVATYTSFALECFFNSTSKYEL